jgi:hypothetical protein
MYSAAVSILINSGHRWLGALGKRDNGRGYLVDEFAVKQMSSSLHVGQFGLM